MFWQKNVSAAPVLKKNFIAEFTDLTNVSPRNNKNLKVLVRSISAPSINVDFERAYANEYVHYFQNGSIHWEPIQIVMYDYSSTDNNISELKNSLFEYLSKNGVNESNRTAIIELPLFCSQIAIKIFNPYYKDELSVDPYNELGNINFQQRLGDIFKYTKNIATDFIIKNPRINKIDFGSFDYSTDDINTITLTVIPEWCSRQENPPEPPEPNENLNFEDDINTTSNYKDGTAYYGGLGGDPFVEARGREPGKLKD